MQMLNLWSAFNMIDKLNMFLQWRAFLASLYVIQYRTSMKEMTLQPMHSPMSPPICDKLCWIFITCSDLRSCQVYGSKSMVGVRPWFWWRRWGIIVICPDKVLLLVPPASTLHVTFSSWWRRFGTYYWFLSKWLVLGPSSIYSAFCI